MENERRKSCVGSCAVHATHSIPPRHARHITFAQRQMNGAYDMKFARSILMLALLAPTAAHAQDTAAVPAVSTSVENSAATDTVEYDRVRVIDAAKRFFGDASSGIAEQLEKAMDAHGTPTAYITGDEISGAFIGGVRYGRGTLAHKDANGSEDELSLYWQGPTAGYDFGANASKVFFLVYGLEETDNLFQRFPSVDGNLYIGAGIGMTYQRADGVTLVPVRTGLGLRGGANIGYVHFTRKASWLPL